MGNKLDNHAIKTGSELASAVMKSRAKVLKKRASVLRRTSKARHAELVSNMLPQAGYIRLMGGAVGSNGVLVAEGDSWFDYPLKDVLSCLEDEHGYDVESLAHKGDRVENMAYADGQLDVLSRRIEKLIRQGNIPKAILLSGGGNDIAGDEFGMLLNHKLSPISGLNNNVVDGVMERLRHAYLTIISAVTYLCKEGVGKEIPILIHGYDYPIPDGRGFMGGWGPLPGPWLEPGFREKGFDQMPERLKMVTNLIDSLNSMLQQVANEPRFAGNVIYIDLRGTLSKNLETYKKDWSNELHPSGSGFSMVTKKFAAILKKLP